MKQPNMPFCPGDWLKDPSLAKCSPATRGIWMDALCLMHENRRSGVLRGTREQLSRSLRCTSAELDPALAEIAATHTGDVAESDGIVTLINRRMRRQAKTRQQTTLRVSRHRQKKVGNANVAYVLPSPIHAVHACPQPPKLEEVKAWAQMIGCPESEAVRFFHHYESSGWIDKNGHPVVNPRSKLAVWASSARARPIEAAHHAAVPGGPAPAVSPGMDLMHKKEQLKRVEDAIAKLRNFPVDPTRFANPEHGQRELQKWKDRLAALKTQRIELMKALGYPLD